MPRKQNLRIGIHRMPRRLIRSAGLLLATVALSVNAAQIDIPGPAGSGAFGATVTVLPNGNIVVTDPGASVPMANMGAMYLYSPTGVLISTLTGSSANDRVGDDGVTVLSNGNYVIRSTSWDNGATANVGAVTWASGSTGLAGVVSPANSLIGTTTNDIVGSAGVTALSNGNYVVRSNVWDNGVTANVGAVTWANGSMGLAGVVSPANSLIGTTANDFVGNIGVTALSNGNYVVRSPNWNNGVTVDAGAASWANGSTGLAGVVSPANSLVGSTTSDLVGLDGVTALSNGNYVVASSLWDNGATGNAGAVTWANGSTGLSGAVLPANSLVGTTTGDSVGNRGGAFGGVSALSNGNYVVASSSWDNGATANVGAVTWANGSAGLSGAVSPADSLIGTTTGNFVGSAGVSALSNGNYAVASPLWDNGATTDVGAVTWANGSTGLTGVVSPANSLIGTTTGNSVGSGGVAALSNGNYVVASPFWDNGATANVGAVTWANGSTELAGVISPGNSLIGTTTSDNVGGNGVTALSNGNYVVGSINWDNGATANVGAATWANGSTGLSGAVSPANSLIGTASSDQVGNVGVTALSNGNYVVLSRFWDNGVTADAGAVSLALGSSGLIGTILPANSVRGTVAGGGTSMVFGYDLAREQLVVGRRASNIVSLFTLPPDLLFANGFE